MARLSPQNRKNRPSSACPATPSSPAVIGIASVELLLYYTCTWRLITTSTRILCTVSMLRCGVARIAHVALAP